MAERHEARTPEFKAMMERAMKRVVCLTVAIVMMVAGSVICGMSQSQPLGDYARAVKKAKSASAKSSKTYDNDTMRNTGTVSVVGAATGESDASSASNPEEKSDAEKKPEMKAGQSAEDRDKALGDWKQKIDDQKGKVDLLSREVNVLQRERQVKQADFYSST